MMEDSIWDKFDSILTKKTANEVIKEPQKVYLIVGPKQVANWKKFKKVCKYRGVSMAATFMKLVNGYVENETRKIVEEQQTNGVDNDGR